MSIEFYAAVLCSKRQILIFVFTQQKLETVKYDLGDDFNSCFTDLLNQLIQKSELIWKDPYGWRCYLN
jgi:hypothetical protein